MSTRRDRLVAIAKQEIISEHWSGSPALLTVGGNKQQRESLPNWIDLVASMFASKVVDAILRAESNE